MLFFYHQLHLLLLTSLTFLLPNFILLIEVDPNFPCFFFLFFYFEFFCLQPLEVYLLLLLNMLLLLLIGWGLFFQGYLKFFRKVRRFHVKQHSFLGFDCLFCWFDARKLLNLEVLPPSDLSCLDIVLDSINLGLHWIFRISRIVRNWISKFKF